MTGTDDRNRTVLAHLAPLKTALELWFENEMKFDELPGETKERVRLVRGSQLFIECYDGLSPPRRRRMAMDIDDAHAERVLRHEASIRGIEWPEEPLSEEPLSGTSKPKATRKPSSQDYRKSDDRLAAEIVAGVKAGAYRSDWDGCQALAERAEGTRNSETKEKRLSIRVKLLRSEQSE